MLKDINTFYHHLLTEFRGEKFDTVVSTAHQLKQKLLMYNRKKYA